MSDYYGRLDTRKEKMPSTSLQKVWVDHAKKIYEGDGKSILVTMERFIMNYVGNQIADYQERVRERENAGGTLGVVQT